MNKVTYPCFVVIRLYLSNRKKISIFSIVLAFLLFTNIIIADTGLFSKLTRFFEEVPVTCNTEIPVALTNLNFTDLTVESETTGFCIGCSIQNTNNIVDAVDTNYATAITTAGFTVTHTITVTDNTSEDTYAAGGYAGFLIENSSVLKADLLNALVIRTYLDGVEQETKSANTLAVIDSDLLGANQYYVGFYTTANFDSIEISISSIDGVLSSTRIYTAVTNSFCQGPDLICNIPTALTKPDFPVRIVDDHTGFGGVLSLGNISDTNNAIDSNSNSYASINFNAGVIATGSMAIKDEIAEYGSSHYVAFNVENTSILALELLDAITITTYLDGILQESKTGSSGLTTVSSNLLFPGTSSSQVGFITSLPFDEAQISIQQTLSLDLGSTRIYGLIVESFCAGSSECQQATVLSNPLQPVIINNSLTGLDGIACVGCEVDNASNVISENNSDYASINITAGVTTSASISVLNVLDTYQVGTEAGFIIRDTNDLLLLDLLNSLTIETYLDGTLQESKTGGDLLALNALGIIEINPTTTDGFYLVGFKTSQEYDEIRIYVAALIGVNNTLEIYGSYVDTSIIIEANVINESAIAASDGSLSVSVSGGTAPYTYSWSPNGETTDTITGLSSGIYSITVTDSNGCETSAEYIIYTNGVQAPIPCNTDELIHITSEGFTDLSVSKSTDGICLAGCGISNENNLIDTDLSNYASMTTLAGLGVTHTLNLTDDTLAESFPSGGFAGFLIGNNTILQADLLEAIVIKTYLDGVQQEAAGGIDLVTINSALLANDQYFVGFYTTTEYDAIEISISSLLGVLSTTNIYAAVTNNFCQGPDLACNTPTQISKPEFPVRIVGEHTGTGGVLNIGSVINANYATDSNIRNYASLNFTLGVAANLSLAIKDELSVYPESTFAGFDIENSSILETDLFNAITISTYLNGVLVESKTGADELISLNSNLLYPSQERTRIGFSSSQAFNEVQITLSQLASVNLGSTRVYGSVLASFCAGSPNCDGPYVLNNPTESVIINSFRTGIDGLLCVGCEVDNAQNIISSDNSDFASINVLAGVAETASISVKDVLIDYPIGSVAGFVIRDTNDLLETDLLNSITITTYLDNIQQEQRSGVSLLALEALGLINITPTSTDSFYLVSFETSLIFDEIRLTVASLVGVINALDVYGAFIDTTNTELCETAEIAVVKTAVFNDDDSDGCTSIGETISYTFTVSNEGNVSINSVELNDPLLGGIIALASGDTDSDSELDVDETWIYISDYSISSSDIDTGLVSNQATVTGTGANGSDVSDLSDDDSVLEDDITTTALCQSAAIALIKTAVLNDEDSDGCTSVGESITYTFTVSNEGNVSINSVELNDPLLGGIIALSSGDIDSDSELDVDETWIYTSDYSISSADINVGLVSNQATVTGTGANGSDVSDLSDDDSVLEDDITTTALCQPSEEAAIALIKTAVFNDEDSDGCTSVGETITYTFTVSNEGNVSINAVELNDPLLGGIIALSSGDLDSDSELDVDETWIYTSDYSINSADIDAGLVSNQATVTGTGANGSDVSDLSDDDSVLEDDITTTALCQSAAIALIKTAVFNDEDADGCTSVGETISYTFIVSNEGNVSINSVELNDPLLGGIIALSSGDLDSDSELGVDETWIYTSDYSISSSDIDTGLVSNQATVTGTGANGSDVSDLSDDDSVLEDDITTTNLCQPSEEAAIALIKTAVFNDEDSDGCTSAGETISYTFTLSNEGNVSINSVELNDPLLGGIIALASGDLDSDSELDVDETWIYTSDYSISSADIDAGLVSNQATVTGTGANAQDVSDLSDNDSVLEDDITTTTLCQPSEVAAIALIKTAVFNDEDSDGCTSAGETISYTFTVSNEGNVSIHSVELNDPLLGGIIALSSGDLDSDSELDVDETWIYTSDYSISSADINVGLVSNQATVTGTGANGSDVSDLSDDDSVLEDDITTTTLCQPSEEAAIALIKTAVFNDEDSDGCTSAGETISYTFTLSNEGNVSINSVELNDPLLGGIIALASGDLDSDSELDVDETWIYTSDYSINSADIDAGLVSNQATVTGTGADGSNVTDLSDDDSVLEDDITNTTLCQPSEVAAIALIKTAVFNDEDSDGCTSIGETISYTFTVSNQGNVSINSVELNDPLLGGIIALASGDLDSDSELDVDETWIYTSDYSISSSDIDAGLVSNQATVTGTGANGSNVTDLSDDDSVLEDDITNTTLCQPSEVAAIALIKTAVFNDEDSDGCTSVGETITYTFTVSNLGNEPIGNIGIFDAMLIEAITLSSGDVNSDNILDVNETWIYNSNYILTQTDLDAGQLSNQASATGVSTITASNVRDESDDDSIFEDDITLTSLCTISSLSLEKAAVFNDENQNGYAEVGETISYSFILYNTGSTTIYDIAIDDPLEGMMMNGTVVTALLPGAIDDTTFTATYSITSGDIQNQSVVNQAVVTGFTTTNMSVTDTSDDPNDPTNNDINNDGEPDDPTIVSFIGQPDEEFEIFNGFTPDGDGLNEFFKIVGIENFPQNNLKIFNRWGVLVYETDGYGIDGNVFRGVSEGRVTIAKQEELPTGSYFYVLKRFLINQETLTNEGYVYIKRN